MSKLVGLVKQGFNEIPEVMISTILGICAFPLGYCGVLKYVRENGDNKRYKATYIIMRSDDPRVKFVHKD